MEVLASDAVVACGRWWWGGMWVKGTWGQSLHLSQNRGRELRTPVWQGVEKVHPWLMEAQGCWSVWALDGEK